MPIANKVTFRTEPPSKIGACQGLWTNSGLSHPSHLSRRSLAIDLCICWQLSHTTRMGTKGIARQLGSMAHIMSSLCLPRVGGAFSKFQGARMELVTKQTSGMHTVLSQLLLVNFVSGEVIPNCIIGRRWCVIRALSHNLYTEINLN